jgi:hypothetical protein
MIFHRNPRPSAPADDSKEKGISTERQKQIADQVDAETSAEKVKEQTDPPPKPGDQWAQASEPEVPARPDRGPITYLDRSPEEWKPSPGIEVMNKMYPGSQPLFREQPPQKKRVLTVLEARKEARRRGWVTLWGNWRAPYLKRYFLEEFAIDPRTMPEPMPIPTSVDHHDSIIIARLKEAARVLAGAAPIAHRQAPPQDKSKPRQGVTFFSAHMGE